MGPRCFDSQNLYVPLGHYIDVQNLGLLVTAGLVSPTIAMIFWTLKHRVIKEWVPEVRAFNHKPPLPKYSYVFASHGLLSQQQVSLDRCVVSGMISPAAQNDFTVAPRTISIHLHHLKKENYMNGFNPSQTNISQIKFVKIEATKLFNPSVKTSQNN